MDFLKTLYEDKAMTFDELVVAVNVHNKANKDNQIKTLNNTVKNHEGDIQK